MKQLRKWLLYIAGVAIIILMLWDLIFSKHGYFVFEQEQHQKQQLQAEIKALKVKKEMLSKKVIQLREDPKTLEEVIHRELGYVYPDETMIIMPASPNKAEKDKKK